MTIDEAKDYIREWCPYDRQEEIIKALEQEPCEDAISRQAAIEAVGSMLRRKFGIGGNLAEITLAELPSTQPEIIRCKDCKHRYVEDMIWHCPFGLMGGENFFCGYGSLKTVERRRDE